MNGNPNKKNEVIADDALSFTAEYRSIASCIFFSLITFGIYYLYWQYTLIKNIRVFQDDDEKDGGGNIVLCLLIPFYAAYWWFSRGEIVRRGLNKMGQNAACNGGVLLILSLIGFNILSAAIMQKDFNDTEETETTINYDKEVLKLEDKLEDPEVELSNKTPLVGYGQFCNRDSLIKIIIPVSVKLIEECAFLGCHNLKSIVYKGTKEQWLSIKKEESWDEDTGEYTVYCVDGNILKS